MTFKVLARQTILWFCDGTKNFQAWYCTTCLDNLFQNLADLKFLAHANLWTVPRHLTAAKDHSLALFIYQHRHKPSDCQVGPLTAGVGPSLNQGMQPLPPILALDSHTIERVEKRSERKKILFSLHLCFHLLHILGAMRQKGKKGSYKSFSKGREKKWAARRRRKKGKRYFWNISLTSKLWSQALDIVNEPLALS